MNQPSKTSPRHWNEIVIRFLLIFLPLAIFFGSLTLLFFYRDVSTAQDAMERSESYKISSQMKLISSRFKAIITDLEFLALHSDLSNYLIGRNQQDLTTVSEKLLQFSSIKKIYNEIQLIDENGLELLQVLNTDGISSLGKSNNRPSKSWHSYFQETINLPKGSVYISPFDLNSLESTDGAGQPVVRFSMAIMDDSETPRGIIVLKHPISYLIEELEATAINSPGKTLLVAPEGSLLNRPEEQTITTDSSVQPSVNIGTFLPKEWAKIHSTESGQFTSENGLMTFNTIYPMQASFSIEKGIELQSDKNSSIQFLWKTISYVPDRIVDEWPEKILGRILLLYGVCLIIIAICSFFLARTSVRKRQIEKTMRENEEELRAINEAAANAIIAIDNHKNVVHWNPAAERLFQYTAQEVVDKPITSIISPPKHQSTFSKLSKKLDIAETASIEAKTIELYGYKKDGTEFPVEVSFSAFKKGDQWHTVGIIRDISIRKTMEKEVLKANKFESLGVLSSGIAHDFNNLLTAILGNINLVSKLSGTPPDSIELLKNAEKASRRAKALTQQLLTFSKEGMPIRKTTALDGLIRNSVEYALHGSTIVSSFDIVHDLLLVDIDSAQIEQVIQNIVTNSRQSISGSGAIGIRCRNVLASDIETLPSSFSGKYVEITIQDTGHGILPKYQHKIFDPYYTTREHGSGLGLTIALSIIQRHDGHIAVESAVDKGTVFSVYLPAAVDQHIPEEKKKENSKGKRFKILVVDNEEMLLSIAGRMLVHLGHECVCARTAREALDIYKHLWKTGTPVDGVIVDLTLPGGMGGKETAGAIFDINSEARIIVSSGYSNDPVMIDFDEYGFCAAIAKPFDMEELNDVIEAVLE